MSGLHSDNYQLIISHNEITENVNNMIRINIWQCNTLITLIYSQKLELTK